MVYRKFFFRMPGFRRCSTADIASAVPFGLHFLKTCPRHVKDALSPPSAFDSATFLVVAAIALPPIARRS